MRYRRLLILLALLVSLLVAPVARGDVASTIQGDLENAASAVPGAQVTVALPATGSDAALVSSQANVSVTYTPPIGSAIAGIVPPAGAPPLYSTTAAQLPTWDLAVLEAVKHSIAAGNQIGSVSITRSYAGLDSGGSPDLLTAAPSYVPFPATSLTMTDAQVQAAVAQSLPQWAQNSTVVVVDDAAGARAVTISLTEPGDSFGILDPRTLLAILLRDQVTLATQGANIGRVIVKVSDTQSGQPLYTGVGDVSIAFDGDWYSPLVAGLASGVPSPGQITTRAALAMAAAQNTASSHVPPVP